MAEWLGCGLQIHLSQFDSGLDLQILIFTPLQNGVSMADANSSAVQLNNFSFIVQKLEPRIELP